MPRVDKLAVAGEAIRLLPNLVRQGTYNPATATQPAFWERKIGVWTVVLAENVLLCPVDPALSMLLDVWPLAGGGKVFSVSWMPDQPWVPPRVVQCKLGSWQSQLLSQGGPSETDTA